MDEYDIWNNLTGLTVINVIAGFAVMGLLMLIVNIFKKKK